MGFAYHLDWIGEQLADHNLLMHHWQRVFPGEILEIRYEDIVDDPATSARRMLDHIGVDWEPQVLDFYDAGAPRQDRQRLAGAPAALRQLAGEMAPLSATPGTLDRGGKSDDFRRSRSRW